MILYSHIVISLNGNSEIVIKIMTINIDISNDTTCIYKILQLYLIIIILSIIMIRPEFFLLVD